MPCLSPSDCPRADDPVTPGVYERQLIDCQCQGSCSGYFRLTAQGQTTGPIPYDATPEFVKFRLEVGG